MTLDQINNNPQLVQKLKSLYSSLDSVLKDDAEYKKLSYRPDEVSIITSTKNLNERLMFNRMRKVNSLVELVEHWDAFQIMFKDNPIVKRIGVEFLEDKLFFDKSVLTEIRNYPSRNQVLYYFQKNQEVSVPNLEIDSYFNFKAKILASIEKDAQLHLEHKRMLLSGLNVLNSIKSSKTLDYLCSLQDGNTPSGKVNAHFGDILPEVRKHIVQGNFKVQEVEDRMLVEIPLAGSRMENGKEVKYSSSVFSFHKERPTDFNIEVGTLDTNKPRFSEKLEAIREKCLSSQSHSQMKI